MQGAAPWASAVADADGDVSFASCPLANLVNNVANYAAICEYTEYRMRKCTVHVMLHTATANYVATSAEHGLGNISTLGTTASKDTFLT